MKIEYWDIDEDLKKELDDHYKTAYSLSLTPQSPLEIAAALTFDGLVKELSVSGLSSLLDLLNEKFVNGKIKGVGLEVGSGPGTFVAAFANMSSVSKMYGVEACEAIVKQLMEKTVSYIAGENLEKIVGVVGEFNSLEVPNDSVDFVFDFFSLHHSPYPGITLKEIYRVLKPGGVLICIDKARADSLTEEQLDKLLEKEYSAAVKRSMGIPDTKRHTRRMNGENEYRLKDWQRFATEAGFCRLEHYNVAKIGGLLPVRMVKHVLLRMSIEFQARLSKYISRTTHNNLEPANRIFTNLFPEYPREFSLMIMHK